MSSKAKRSGGLQGPRPQPLSLSPATASTRLSKKPRIIGGPGPVIVYERTPRVVHARPHEFMAVVQKLTGKQQKSTTTSTATTPVPTLPSMSTATFPGEARDADDEATTTAADPLVLTLATSPSPAAGSLLSPSSFFFSPTTMKAIQELIS